MIGNQLKTNFHDMQIVVVKADELFYNSSSGKSFRLIDEKGKDNLVLNSTVYMTEKLYSKFQNTLKNC